MIIPELLLLITATFLVFFLRQRGELNQIWGYRLLGLAIIAIISILTAFFLPRFWHVLFQLIGGFLIFAISASSIPFPFHWSWGLPASLWVIILLSTPATAIYLLYGSALTFLAATLQNRIEKSNTLLHPQRKSGRTTPVLTNVFTHIPLGLIVTDGELKIRLANPTAVKYLGVHEKKLHQQPLTTILSPLFAKQSKQDPTKKTSKIIQLNTHQLNCRLTPLDSGFFLTMRDITAEQQHEIHQQQSLNTISQEMRSPLTTINAYTELLAKETYGPLNPTQQSFVAKIETGVDQIIKLINNTWLILANQGKSNEEVDSTLTDFAATARQIIIEFTPIMLRHQHKFSLQLTQEIILIRIDPDHIITILQELLHASLAQSDPEDPITLQAYLTPNPDTTQELLIIQIISAGTAVPIDQQQALWTKFVDPKNSQTTQPDYNETDLGLEIVRTLVESYNGRVWFDTQPDQGNIFTVILPTQQPRNNQLKMLI